MERIATKRYSKKYSRKIVEAKVAIINSLRKSRKNNNSQQKFINSRSYSTSKKHGNSSSSKTVKKDFTKSLLTTKTKLKTYGDHKIRRLFPR